MSSMRGTSFIAIALASTTMLAGGAPAMAQDGQNWDQARAELVARQPTGMAQAIQRWDYLTKRRDLSFEDYAGFLLTYPDFPKADTLRIRAENALEDSIVSPQRLVAYFDALPPLTNAGKARYALALATLNRPQAFDVARDAWRGGKMSGPSEAYMLALYGTRFTSQDHDARMDALLWQSEAEAAARQLANVSAPNRDRFGARLALIQGSPPSAAGLAEPAGARSDPGYAYNLANYYRNSGQLPSAINLLAGRQSYDGVAFDPEDFIGVMLRVARGAGSDPAVRIAASAPTLFAPGTDISTMSYRLRDDYTSLMWLGGTQALWSLGDGGRAAPLFYQYGAAAQTPQTRSKGFYWAGLAAQRAGDRAEAQRYWTMAAAYPDRFYGQLALSRLGRPLPALGPQDAVLPNEQMRREFAARPLTKAVREVAVDAPWSTGIQFYRAIAEQADTVEEHQLVADLAREIGRRDLAVNVAEAAAADGFDRFAAQGFPTIPLPSNIDWTMTHAIARQESQFAQNAISHAGARGLMQLMPGTAREQAGKSGVAYMSANLIEDPVYNMRLGAGYFARMMDYFNGSYPLAVAAYNAGPGNVNKWLRANGDPRNGSVDWVTWIEQIPLFETKNYVQRVLENAAVYEQLYPDKASWGQPRMVGDFLR